MTSKGGEAEPEHEVARLEDLVAEQITKSGEESEGTAIARRDLAAALERAGRVEDALAVRKRLLQSIANERGTEHFLVAQQELHVAEDLRRLARFDEAHAHAEHAFNVFGKSDVSQHAWLIATKKCLAYIEDARNPAFAPQPRNVRRLYADSRNATSQGVVDCRITKEWKDKSR